MSASVCLRLCFQVLIGLLENVNQAQSIHPHTVLGGEIIYQLFYMHMHTHTHMHIHSLSLPTARIAFTSKVS